MDVGIKLSDKADQGFETNRIIDVINGAVEEYGYRIQGWGEWEKFRKSCAAEEVFVTDLYTKLHLS